MKCNMEKNKKISVILPVYNGEEHVGEAIESVLNQTYSNLELVIVNDCSTDTTLKILESYARKDSRIRIITNPVNYMLPRSLNEGFLNATGEYFTWTSDDNRYKPEALEKLIKILQNDKDAVMVYSDFSVIDGEDRFIDLAQKDEPDKLPFYNPVGACFLYTREVAQKVGGYDANLFLAEDYDYWIRIWREGKVVHSKEDLYLYRLHDKSLTSTRKDAIQSQVYKTVEKHFLYLYSKMNSRKDKIRFLDNMLELGCNNKVLILKQLSSVYSLYYIHISYVKLKKGIWQFVYRLRDFTVRN